MSLCQSPLLACSLIDNFVHADCDKRFYTLHAYYNHLLNECAADKQLVCSRCAVYVPFSEELKHQLERHCIGRYACVNCAFGTNSGNDLREHMWRQHPNKLLYATARVRRDDVFNVSTMQ